MVIMKSFLRKLNKKLDKMFDGKVTAHEDSGCLILSGELERWSDVVLAGLVAAKKSPFAGLVNDIECTGETAVLTHKPRVEDSSLEWEEPDVLIIGGGVIGCAIARELSRYKVNVLLVEKENDIAMQASGRNDGLIRSGMELKKNTQKHKYNKLGNQMFDELCAELGVDFKRTGQYLCFKNRLWNFLMIPSLLYWNWLGIKGVKVVRRDELRTLEPAIDPSIGSALFFPATGVICPFSLTVAYAENAVHNGVNISLDTMVQAMVLDDGVIKSVKTNRGTIHPKVVVNAAGVFCDEIAAMAGDRFYSIHPQKGTNIILDKKYSDNLVQTAVSFLGGAPTRKKPTKGGGVIRTVYGSVLIGPDTLETINKEDFSTTQHNVKEILTAHSQICPAIDEQQIITYFSGIRASTYEDDFVIRKGRYVTNLIHAAGIQSPGLTAAPAIGVDVASKVVELFGGASNVEANTTFNPRRVAPLRPSLMDSESRSALIESNPDYGVIICRCEEISKGEVLDALRRNVRCNTVDGVKRRVRPGMGRCQGGFCSPLVLDIIADEYNITLQKVKKSGSKSEVVFGNAKTLEHKRDAATNTPAGEKIDPETEERLREKAKEMLAISMMRKDSDDDADE